MCYDADLGIANMFSCCDRDGRTDKSRESEVYESSSAFAILLRLLHNLPPDYPTRKELQQPRYAIITPTSAIPFPVLPLLFQLADKYVVSPAIVHALQSHLYAYASTFPLKVYGLASQLGLDWMADEASAFLVQPPLHTYTQDEVKLIPTAEAYHKLLILQHHRVEKIKDLLAHEELFPHGYGVCSAHKGSALAFWDQKRKSLLGRVDAGVLRLCCSLRCICLIACIC